MPEKYILAVDQSTSGTKALLVDSRGGIAAKAAKEHMQHYPNSGWVEHDPMEIYGNVKHVMREALHQARLSADELAAVTITNQRETAVVWDAESGLPIYRAIVWQCQRTAEICKSYREAGFEQTIRRKTGLMLDPYFSATKFQWILQQVPGAREKAANGQLRAGTIDSWLVWKLTQGSMHATDYTNASRTLLFNIHTLQWDDELLGLFGIPASMLPEVRSSDDLYGYTEDPDALGARVPISGVIGDSQAALFGQMCVRPGMAKATYGTGTSLMMNVGNRPVESENGLVTTIAWTRGGQTTYALEAVIRTTGDTLKWLKDQLHLFETYEELNEWVGKTRSNEGVYLVPAFVGMGAPYWDPYARAAIVGMTRGAGKGHILRAALESIAYQVRDAAQLMQVESGIELDELRVDGGASDNRLLMQFQADILNKKVVKMGVAEFSAIGSALLGGLYAGIWNSVDEMVGRPNNEAVYAPGMQEDKREQLYDGWKKAVAMVVHQV